MFDSTDDDTNIFKYYPEDREVEAKQNISNEGRVREVFDLFQNYDKGKIYNAECIESYMNLDDTNKVMFWNLTFQNTKFSELLIQSVKTTNDEMDYLIQIQKDHAKSTKDILSDCIKKQYYHITKKLLENNIYKIDPNDTFLFDASDNCDIYMFKLLLDHGQSPQVRATINGVSQTIFHYIANNDNVNFSIEAFDLIKEYSIYDSRNSLGEIPLVLSIHKRNFELFKKINKYSSIFGEPDNKGRTAIHDAAIAGVDFLKYCLNNKKEQIMNIIDLRDNNGETAINQEMISLESIESLVGIGADVLIPDNNGKNILHKMIEEAQITCIEYLMKNEKIIDLIRHQDVMGNNALHVAASLKDAETKAKIIQSLISIKLPNEVFTACNKDGNSPIGILVKIDEVVPFKVVGGIVDNEGLVFAGNQSIWHIIATHNSKQIAETLDSFIPSKDDNENTPLHIAAELGHNEVGLIIVNKFIEKFDVTAQNKIGMTAAMLAPIDSKLYRSLRSYDQSGGIHTTFFSAVKAGNLTRVKEVVSQKQFKHTYNYPSGLHIHVIAQYGTFEMMMLVLDSHSKIKAKNKYGENILEIALKNGNENVALAILQKIKDGEEDWKDLASGKKLLEYASNVNPLNEKIFSSIFDNDLASEEEKNSMDIIGRIIDKGNMNLLNKMKPFIGEDSRRSQLLLKAIPVGIDMFNAVLDGDTGNSVTSEVLHKASECHSKAIIEKCLSLKDEAEAKIAFFDSPVAGRSIVTNEIVRIYDHKETDFDFLYFLLNISANTVKDAKVNDLTLGEYISGKNLNDELIELIINNNATLSTNMLSNLIENNSECVFTVASILESDGWNLNESLLTNAALKCPPDQLIYIVKNATNAGDDICSQILSTFNEFNITENTNLDEGIRNDILTRFNLIFHPPEPTPADPPADPPADAPADAPANPPA